VELEQRPAGSHLASAVRQAAWQFRVRPPRKNGRPMIGEWVRIRIDYIQSDTGGSFDLSGG
jgi:protein TonB